MTQSAIALTLGSITIRQHNGLFSLNDLHKAAGGEAKHQPALFMRMDQTKALIEEISSSTKSQSLVFETVLGKGKAQGTYACRELVIAYAAWISAAFHLKVIRVFLAVAAPQTTPYSVAPGQTLSAEQAQFLRTMLTDWVDSFPKDKQAAFMTQGWSKLKAHFKTDYRRIPAGEYHEAVNILARHIGGWMRDYNIITTQPDPALPAPAIDPLNAQAMAAASKQANEYFDAARQGKYTDATAIPPEVLCGLLAQAMLQQRFMLSFDRDTGRMNIKPVPDDAFVLSWPQFARGVVTNDIMATNTELAEMASACNRRLAQRLAA